MRALRYLLIFLLVTVILFSVGCFAVPEPEPEPDICVVCEGGHYFQRCDVWYVGGCDDTEPQPAGTYWHNADGSFCLIGDTVYPLLPTDVYGACPI